MSKRMKISETLEKLNNIRMDCSDTDDENYETESEAEESEYDVSSTEDEISDTADNSESESELQNILNIRKRRYTQELSSAEEEDNTNAIAADGTCWEKMREGGGPGRLPIHSVFKDVSGPTGYAKRNIIRGKVSSAFSLIIDDRMLEHIRSCTELEAARVLGKKWILSKQKLKCFIGVLYGRGAYEAKNLSVSYLWNQKWGPSFFAKAMSRKDFSDILRFIRFDKKSERSQRLRSDKFALVSAVWDKFIENSQNSYKPGQNITIDEQLLPTKARCRFTQYMPNKPDKFGIKFWLACDVDTKYIANGFPYLGKDETRAQSQPLSEYVVLKLIEPFTMKGRNVTTDNFFTSAPLASKLLAKKTTLVGTIRGNKRELPNICKTKKDSMATFSTELYKSSGHVLSIYKSKPKKRVFVLSSKHKSVSIQKAKKLLPETVEFYNKTKFGVDIADQMAKKYSVKSGSRRWPLQVFFNILDLGGINAWILYKDTTGEKISRRKFLLQLAEELAFENDKPRAADAPTGSNTIVSTRKWCQIGNCNNNKTNIICEKCGKYVCGKCTKRKAVICRVCPS